MKFNSIYLTTLFIGSTLANAGQEQSQGKHPELADETSDYQNMLNYLMEAYGSAYQGPVNPPSSKEEGSYQEPKQDNYTSKEEDPYEEPKEDSYTSKEEEHSTQNPGYPEEPKEENPYDLPPSKEETPVQNDAPYFPPAYNQTETETEDKYGKSNGGNDTETDYPDADNSTMPVESAPVESPIDNSKAEQSPGKTEELGGGSGAATISVSITSLVIAALYSAIFAL